MSAQWMFSMLSPSGVRARLTVLIYHRVLADRDPLFPNEPDAGFFETQMRWMQRWFNVLPLSEAVERLSAGRLPARAAAITFDDGYANNCTVALPILRRLCLPATFFIATGYLNGGRMWNDTVIDVVRRAKGPQLDLSALDIGQFPILTMEDRQRSLNALLGKLKYLDPDHRERLVNEIAKTVNIQPPNDLMLTSDQVRILSDAEMTIGAHTVNHPILSRVSEGIAKDEMAQSKRQLEMITGREVKLFAYPNGKPGTDYSASHALIAREVGFAAAVSTGLGAATRCDDIFQIPRFTPWDISKARFSLRLALNLRQAAAVV
jgi:peptidoglycan/xylan/chitin deacetylase (PgdA/CDA1 family)